MKGTISYWAGILAGGIAVGVWALLAAGIWLLLPDTGLRPRLLIGVTLLLGAVLVYLPFLRRSCRFLLTGDYIEYESGILYHVRRRIRCSAVMVVTEIHTPLSHLCHTRTLLISAMGGSMLLPLLRAPDAADLLAWLPSAESGDDDAE